MSKTKFVKGKHVPNKIPIGATALAYLLYKELSLTPLQKGVFLTFAIIFLILAWGAFIYQLVGGEGAEPEWKSE